MNAVSYLMGKWALDTGVNPGFCTGQFLVSGIKTGRRNGNRSWPAIEKDPVSVLRLTIDYKK